MTSLITLVMSSHVIIAVTFVLILIRPCCHGKGKTRDDDNDEEQEEDVGCEEIKNRLHAHGKCFKGSDIHIASLQILSHDRVLANIRLFQFLLLMPDAEYDHQGLLDEFIEPYHYEWLLYTEGTILDPIYGHEYVLVLLSKYESMDSCFQEHLSQADSSANDDPRTKAHHEDLSGDSLDVQDEKLKDPLAPPDHQNGSSIDLLPLNNTHFTTLKPVGGNSDGCGEHKEEHTAEEVDWPRLLKEGKVEYLGIDFFGGQYYEIYENETAIMLQPVIIDIDRYEYTDILARFEITIESNNANKFYAETKHYWLTGQRSLIGRTFALYTVPNEIANVTTDHNNTRIESTSSRHDDLVLRRSNRLGCGVVGYASNFPVTGDSKDKYLPTNTANRRLLDAIITAVGLSVFTVCFYTSLAA